MLSKKEITLIAVGAVNPDLIKPAVDAVLNGLSGYQTEQKYNLPKNTALRSINKLKKKIEVYENLR